MLDQLEAGTPAEGEPEEWKGAPMHPNLAEEEGARMP